MKKKYSKAELELLKQYYKAVEEAEAKQREERIKKKMEYEKAKFLYGD